ncbi:MAG: hypothetical protein M1821_006849 [Bathelium mastoideum]|nr:MAG: hypothetical protein M1821_006849 [Bathelium mastoideum]
MQERKDDETKLIDVASKAIDSCSQLLDTQAELSDLTASLKDARQAVQDTLPNHFDAAILKRLESRLWNLHVALNGSFRKAFDRQETTQNPSLSKTFLAFIKSSQAYYRDHVRSLGERHGLGRIALPATGSLSRNHKEPNNHRNHRITYLGSDLAATSSCYNALISLGDLSRWRELLLPGTPMDWKPARSYYSLAGSIHPQFHVHHNQLAMTFTAEKDHFNTLYHLYSCHARQIQSSAAARNLQREMEKISAEAKSDGLDAQVLQHQDSSKLALLIVAFLNVHCVYFTSKNLRRSFLALEDEFLECFRSVFVDDDEQTEALYIVVYRMILMNVAAEQSTLLFRRLNLRFSSALFEAFVFEAFASGMKNLNERSDYERSDYEWSDRERSDALESNMQLVGMLTERGKHLLRLVRICGFWIAKNCIPLSESLNEREKRRTWKLYAKVLTMLSGHFPMLADYFPKQQLPSIDTPLQQDEEIMGFEPLIGLRTLDFLDFYPGMESRERLTGDIETLVGIRKVLICGINLAEEEEDTPLQVDGNTFLFEVPPDL